LRSALMVHLGKEHIYTYCSQMAKVEVRVASRIVNITLRGRAATSEGREEVRAVFAGLPQICRHLGAADLEVLHTSDTH
jgi:hypothetical protein